MSYVYYSYSSKSFGALFLSPLEIKSTPNASTFTKDKLKELVKMKNSEKIMLSVFVSLLLLWAGALGLFFWNFS
ncbi:anion permease [Campylobacter jejuni]|uniref:anion permease n=1 Tax=Campylobacter jejuni TaxID=197 RepID=UPI0009A6DE15|nr:C4-dicarboxylate ABC transporter [Campylobacter jejuni]EAH4642960.1 C4-dicarboxylate ABC transporter [Campylobacter jejuni]EAH4646835.1 C4-dicarboxylate ABC transporter [Campylobacter jejuni]EAH4735916.1 C4-dicarboxylate ABC transporter [Campylobacter jejuni]EAH5402477.1 C4-dicarboxylate ABC transporter [Campylobacter jejuni]